LKNQYSHVAVNNTLALTNPPQQLVMSAIAVVVVAVVVAVINIVPTWRVATPGSVPAFAVVVAGSRRRRHSEL
jgi:hypothetical protein